MRRVTKLIDGYMRLREKHRRLRAAAAAVLERVDSKLNNDPQPMKYTSPWKELTTLRNVLDEDDDVR